MTFGTALLMLAGGSAFLVPHESAGDVVLHAPPPRVPERADGDTAAGMRVYRDPATGAFTAPPENAQPNAGAQPENSAAAAARRRLGVPAQKLVEMPGTSAAGGVTMDLRGGFQSEITATVDRDGHVDTRCDSAAPTRR